MQLPLKNANRTMDLLNKTALKGVPELYDQDGKGEEAIVYLKFFVAGWTWFITEINPEDGIAFGLTTSPQCPEGELGYVSIVELSELKASFCAVERDRHWKPTALKDIRNPCRS